MEKISPCFKLSYWFQSWNQRVCYLRENSIFLARNREEVYRDSIDLFEPGIRVCLETRNNVKYVLLDGVQSAKYQQYKLNFGAANEEWLSCISRLVNLGRIRKPLTVPVYHAAFKYIGLSLAMDWLSLKDLVKIDSTVCNRASRLIFLSLLNEFGVQISKKFLDFTVDLNAMTAHWLIQRGLTASKVEIGNKQLLTVLLRKELYNFMAVLDLCYQSDSDLFYDLLQHCPNLKHLRVFVINHKRKFLSTLAVRNRQLQRLNWHNVEFSIKDLLMFVMHHRNLSIFSKLKCSFFEYKAGIWYQNAPESIFLHDQTALQIKELCLRTNNIKSLTDPLSLEDRSFPLLETQPQLARVALILDKEVISFPLMLSRCSSITFLDLTRRNSQNPLDWSCLVDSSMRLHSLNLFMEYENFLAYAANILSEASVLTFSNHKVVDYQMAAIFLANHNQLTELNIYTAFGLTGEFLRMLGTHAKRLKKLRIPSVANDKLKQYDFRIYAGMGAPALKCLIIPSGVLCVEALPSMALRFSALRHLFLHPRHEEALLKAILDLLGKQLIDLGMEYAQEPLKTEIMKYASGIEGCCEIL